MSATRPPLPVLLSGRHVADVVDVGFGDTAVRYTEAAVADPARSRLSLSLPVQAQAQVHHGMGPGGRWVRSLLPEGRALAWAVREYGVPEDDRYGLIAALGRDVAGAAQVLLPDTEPPSGAGRYERLDADQVAELVGRAHRHGLGLDRRRGVRLSLAGMQDKVLLHQEDGAYLLPLDGAPSTLIVKPEPAPRVGEGLHLPGLATNELFCLTLARLSGLRVATARVEVFGETRALLVDRYDRVSAPGAVHRVHQEDLLGALGRDPHLKYERPQVRRLAPAGGFGDIAGVVAQPGPRLVDLASLLIEHLGAANLGPFVEAVALNVAIGNADAHARNYSVLLDPDGAVTFAPLYDLISTRLWSELDADSAQLVHGRSELDDVTRADLIAEATGWGLPLRFVTSRVEGVLERMAARLDAAVDETITSGGEERFAAQVAALVSARLARLAQPV